MLGQLKQFGYAHPLNHADIHLPCQHVGAFVLQKLLELMHEYDKIQRIQAGFDEVVRFRSGQVVPGFQHVERRLDVQNRAAGSGVLLLRKLREDGKLAFQPHCLVLWRMILPELVLGIARGAMKEINATSTLR